MEGIHSLVRERSPLHCTTRMTVETFHSKTTLLIPWPWQPGPKLQLLVPCTPPQPKVSIFFFGRPPFSFVFVCFSLPLPCSTLKSWTQRVCYSTTRQMVCEIILSRFSFCVSSETRVLLRYTRHIVQVLWLY